MRKVTRRGILGFGAAATSAIVLPSVSHAESHTATPWQTEGPFFPIVDQADKDADMTMIAGRSIAALGEVVEIQGHILDTDGQPIAGALIDIWQANAAGRYAHETDPNTAPLDENFQGWAKLITGDDGSYRVRTIKPGAYPAEEGWVRPPHIHYKVARRGFKEITTQLYFAGDPLNDIDRLLLAVPQPERDSLIVNFSDGPATFDVVLAKA